MDLSLIKPQLQATLAVIEQYSENLSPSLLHLDNDLETNLKDCHIKVGPTSKEHFKVNIQSKHGKAISYHLREILPDAPPLDAFCIFDPSQLEGDPLLICKCD